MNSTTLTIGTTESRAQEVRVGASQLRERLATRIGLALLDWSRRQDELRTSESIAAHRRTERLATESLDREFARVVLSVSAR